ncbi:hypothetical protein [Allorhizocola rhizosphaerae]|uniref:hypothetical protein n=1 Tax=Allorhizocola rhizosphaerae TaxID=1872709 RepID=UPI000E3E7E36|nr:hypothetical protein [Allorhizocola rhizosphaerae]
MDEEIGAFFLRYGDALGRNDLPAIAACYATPSLVVHESANIAVPDGKSVEAAFAGAAEVYSAKGLIGARALINRVDRLTDRLAFVDVTWEYKDLQGGVQPGESYRYLVRVGTKPGICAVIPVA